MIIRTFRNQNEYGVELSFWWERFLTGIILDLVVPLFFFLAFIFCLPKFLWKLVITEKTKEKMKPYFERYQDWMFHANIFQSEVSKPSRFLSEVVQISTLLLVAGVVQKIDPTAWIATYVLIFVVAIIGGKLLIKSGIVKYVTSLGNKQNPEILEIKKGIEEIKESLKK